MKNPNKLVSVDLIIYFEKVSDDMAPKDGKTYYWFNKRNYQIIEESVLKRLIESDIQEEE